MNYHNITKNDMLNGTGLRVVLWVSGCEHHCKGCQNPETWDFDSGVPFDEDAKNELFDACDNNYIEGLTLSGGDPMAKPNRETIFNLLKEFRERFPDKNVWCYTGYTISDLKASGVTSDQLHLIDVIVDGPFKEEFKDTSLKWIGSSNQNILFDF